jgi:hypothetical protein
MVERSLKLIVAGAATVLAAFGVPSALVTSPAMQTPRLTAPPQAAVNDTARAATEPLAFVEPPPLSVLAGAGTAIGVDPRKPPVTQTRPAQAGVNARKSAQQSARRRLKGERAIFRRLRLPNWTPG